MYVKAKEKIENTINTIDKAVSDLKQLITDPKLPNDLQRLLSYRTLDRVKQQNRCCRLNLTTSVPSGGPLYQQRIYNCPPRSLQFNRVHNGHHKGSS